MPRLKSFGWSLVCIVGLIGCLPKDEINYVGALEKAAVKEIVLSTPTLNHLSVTSRGGLSHQAYKIANKMLRDQTSLEVSLLCLSACAEYLLPAANDITFKDDPLIGYHWNPLIIRHYIDRYFDRDTEYCNKVGDQELYNLLQKTGKNTEFWKIVLDKLEIRELRPVYFDGECPKRIDRYKYSLWFPTSNQLRELAGLEFSGTVCADDFETCKIKIDGIWPRGRTFLVGDNEYVSQGSR